MSRIILPIIAASRRRSSYLVSEDFEGTGTPSGWTAVGSPNFDYATSPAPLVGSQSLYGVTGGDGGSATFSAQSEVWAFCRMVRTAVPSATNQTTFGLYNGSTIVARLAGRTAAGRWRFYVGTTIAGEITTGAPENAVLAVWIRYKAGTGANAEGDLYIANGSETRPGSPNISTVVGSATLAADTLVCLGNASSPHIFDKVRVSAFPIGSNPA